MISPKNKPNSNPNKANFGPISRVSKAKQSQFKPNNQSSLIDNHFEGKPSLPARKLHQWGRIHYTIVTLIEGNLLDEETPDMV
jgi:hypothetical protein